MTLRLFLILLTLLALPVHPSLAQQQAEEAEPTAPGDEAARIEIQGEDPPSDAAIAQRLRQIYSSLNLSGEIGVSVESGVVTLSGALLRQAEQQEVVQLARQVEGVVEVANNLENIYDPRSRLEYVYDQLSRRALALLAFLPVLLIAATVLLTFWAAGNLIMRWDWLFLRFARSPFLADLLKQVTRAVLVVTGLWLAVEILDAVALLGAIVGTAGLLGLALGFALRDTIENYIATILLSLRQPFEPNDVVALNGFEGKVVRMTTGATILMTLDGNHVRIPNAQIYKGILINYTSSPQRRFEFELNIDPRADLTQARALAVHALRETPGVLPRPEPLCHVKSLGESTVQLEAFAWTDQGRFDFLKVRTGCIEAVRGAFAAGGVEMPEPGYRLRIEREEALAPAAPGPVIVNPRQEVNPGYLEELEEVQNIRRDMTLDKKISREAAQGQDLLRPERKERA